MADDLLPARERRLREAVRTAEADRLLLAQGWEGDPFGDGVVVDEHDERQFRLWALQDEVASAQQALAGARGTSPADDDRVRACEDRLGQARLALGRQRLEDDLPFGDTAWRLDLAQLREAGREASRRWAEDADLLHRLAVRIPRTLGDTRGATPSTSFLQELAVARSWSTRAVTIELQRARVLVEDLPRTHSALGAGVLALPAARALLDVAADVPELERMMSEPFPVSDAARQEQPQHDPSPALSDLVRTRDRYDDGPVQPRVLAARADLDHEDAHAEGGPTSAANLVARPRSADARPRARRPARQSPLGTDPHGRRDARAHPCRAEGAVPPLVGAAAASRRRPAARAGRGAAPRRRPPGAGRTED